MLSLISVALISATTTVELVRGGALANEETKYFACSDTTISKAAPNTSFGLGGFLLVGKDKRALIRFEDLTRAVGARSKVVGAKLVLSATTLASGKQVTIRRLLKPWLEGPGTGDAAVTDDLMKTTWNHQVVLKVGSGAKWEGGADATDSRLSASVSLAGSDTNVELTGLASDVQQMLDHPETNFGWVIESDGEQIFNSSESETGRPKLVVELEKNPPTQKADLVISGISLASAGSNTAEFVVTVQNAGGASVGGFECAISRWGNELAKMTSGAELAPNQTASLRFMIPLKSDGADPRVNTLGVLIRSAGDDDWTGNNFAKFYPDGEMCKLVLEKGFVAKCEAAGIDAASWAQSLFETWNETYLAFSRFSIARDGCKLRTNLSQIIIADDHNGQPHLAPQETAVLFKAGDAVPNSSTLRSTIRALSQRLGVQDGATSQYTMDLPPPGLTRTLEIIRGHLGTDPFAGVMGAGDTRNETLIPGQLPIPEGYTDDVIFKSGVFEPTGLYSLNDVAGMNASLETTKASSVLPKLLLIQAMDMDGVTIGEGTLALHKISHGSAEENATVTYDIKGDSVLVTNLVQASGNMPALFPTTGDSVAGYLVKLDYRGQTAYAFLKQWQLVDAYGRGNTSAYVHQMRFNVTHAPFKPGNYALRKIAVDSKNSPPSELAKLLDGNRESSFVCDQDWIELDLGRDRPIGEIRLYFDPSAKDRFWSNFEIVGYSTGQTISDAQRIATEQSPNTRPTYCFEADKRDWCLVYRGRPRTTRFVRIIRRSQNSAVLREIEIRETEPAR